MSRPTRRRTHGRKRTHKRGSGNIGSTPLERQLGPNYVQEELRRQRERVLQNEKKREAEKRDKQAKQEEQQRQVKPLDPNTSGGAELSPSDVMEKTAAVQPVEGGAKHEHAVTIVVDYSKDGKKLTESEKKKLLKHIKTNHYYHGALKGKNSMKHEDTATHTRVSVLWNNGKLHKNGEDWDRVHELLTEELPHGIKAKHVHTE